MLTYQLTRTCSISLTISPPATVALHIVLGPSTDFKVTRLLTSCRVGIRLHFNSDVVPLPGACNVRWMGSRDCVQIFIGTTSWQGLIPDSESVLHVSNEFMLPIRFIIIDDNNIRLEPFALAMPVDFKNLRHIYYMNSTIQVIRVIPPLHLAFNKASTTPAGHSQSLQQLSHTTEPLVPDSFLTAPRQAHPQFGEMAAGYLGGSHSKTWKKPTARSSTPCMKSSTRMIQARCTLVNGWPASSSGKKNFEVDPSATSSRSHHHLRSS